MSISARTLNRATLQRQMLLRRESLSIEDAVRRVVALQAQHPASPYLALWNRLTDFDPAALDAAYVECQVVRSILLRITMHAVHVDDYPTFREAMDPSFRSARLSDARFTSTGLTGEDVDALLPELLAFASQPRTAGALQEWLAEQRELDHTWFWWVLRQYAPVWHVPSGGPWQFETQRSYQAPSPRPALADAEVAHDSLQTLIKRYLAGFGPATMPDIAQFAVVLRSRVKAAVQAMGDELVSYEGPDGKPLYDLPDMTLPDEEVQAPPRLLGMWDNVLLAYVDRSRVIPPEYRTQVIHKNGDVLPTLLVDGRVVGVWRTVEEGIEASAFEPLSADVWRGLAAEAEKLLALLSDREPHTYRRYDHWWAKGMPSVEVKVLG